MKNLKIIIPAIVVVIVAIVGVLLVVNNNQQEQVKGTTEVVKTTKEDKTITTEKETTAEAESEKETEITAKVTESSQSTTKTPETTKKPVTNSSGSSSNSNTTQKPATTAPTTQKQETTKHEITTVKPPSTTIDVNTVGNYPVNYCKYCSYKLIGVKPNAEMACPSCKNYIDANPYGGGCKYCVYCGKINDGKTVNGHWTPPHELGGCSRFNMDTECDKCGKMIPAYTCFHGCGISH